jgi:dTDP-4-amino-4,6-dideoxygalactose transaminase
MPEHLVGKREEFLIRTKKKGLPIKNLYPLPLPMMELFKGKVADDCQIAENICKRLFNLYVNPGLSEKDIIEFSNIIKKVYRNLKR